MDYKKALYRYTLRLADSSMIMGQRLSELCSHGPYLEEDIATTNLALDFFGQANAFYNYASKQNINGKSADELAFKRDADNFLNYLLVEQENGHFGDTIAKQFLFSSFQKCFFTYLSNSSDSQLAAIAKKSLKEVTYHLRHNKTWMIRLGDGTKESKKRIQKSINDIWCFTGELFEMDEIDNLLFDKRVSVDVKSIKNQWDKIINETIKEAKIIKPKNEKMISGGKNGNHTKNLSVILEEMQYLPRTYPNAKW